MGKLYSTASPPKKLPTAIFSATNESAIGVDVHLDKMVFCYQRCQFNGDKLEQREFIYRGSRDELRKAAKICFSLQPNVIVMESTGIYWLSLYEMLEDAGFNSDQLIVLNAREVKAARGRKTDYTDALRLTEVGRSGNYKASFIQDKQHRQYRLCFRAMQNTRKHKQRAVNQLHKLLCSVGVRASTVFSDIRGKAASNIICALAAGKDGKKLMRVIEANSSRLKHSPKEIFEALQCDKGSLVWPIIQEVLNNINSLEQSYNNQYSYLKDLILESDVELFDRLQEIPGISETAAIGLISELGPNISKFRSVKNLCSWVGLCPGNTESAGKRISGKCAKGNKYLRMILLEAAHACSHAKNCYLADKTQKLKERRGARKAVVALAHNLLRIIFAMIRDGSHFKNSKTDLLDQFRIRKLEKAVNDMSKTNCLVEGALVVKDKLTGTINTTIDPQKQPKRKKKSVGAAF